MARSRQIRLWLTIILLLGAALAVAKVRDHLQNIRAIQKRVRFEQELICLSLAYHRFAEERGFSPRGLADIESEQGAFPQVAGMIRAGEFILRWNARLTGDGVTNNRHVHGYESNVPSEGGWVLMGGGSRLRMKAEEFHALPLIPTE